MKTNLLGEFLSTELWLVIVIIPFINEEKAQQIC